MEIARGFDGAHRADVAALFWSAFGGKLGRILRPEPKALAFIADILQPGYALSATFQGRLLGVAGFKTARGGFLAGNAVDMARHYGWAGTAWRGPLLELHASRVEAGELLLDGIFVREDARARGVGSALIEAVRREAATRGCGKVVLQVVEENRRARRLYARCGFRECGLRRRGLLAPVLGYRSVVRMEAPAVGNAGVSAPPRGS